MKMNWNKTLFRGFHKHVLLRKSYYVKLHYEMKTLLLTWVDLEMASSRVAALCVTSALNLA